MLSRPQSRRIRSDQLHSARTSRRNPQDQAKSYFQKAKELQQQNKIIEALDNYVKATIC